MFGLRPQHLAPDGSYVEPGGPGLVLALCTHVLGRPSGDDVLPISRIKPAVGCHQSFFTPGPAGTYDRALLLGAPGVRGPARKHWGRHEACLRDLNGLLVVLLEAEEPRPALPGE